MPRQSSPSSTRTTRIWPMSGVSPSVGPRIVSRPPNLASGSWHASSRRRLWACRASATTVGRSFTWTSRSSAASASWRSVRIAEFPQHPDGPVGRLGPVAVGRREERIERRDAGGQKLLRRLLSHEVAIAVQLADQRRDPASFAAVALRLRPPWCGTVRHRQAGGCNGNRRNAASCETHQSRQ